MKTAPRCVVSDPSLDIHPSSGKLRLHNKDLSASGRYLAGHALSTVFSLVSKSCERRSVSIECPDVVDIDDEDFVTQIVRFKERKMRAELDGANGKRPFLRRKALVPFAQLV